VLDTELYTLCKSQRRIVSLRSSRKGGFILILNIDERVRTKCHSNIILSVKVKVKVKVKVSFTLEQATEAQRGSIYNLYFYDLL
jgi:hypothetical protein